MNIDDLIQFLDDQCVTTGSNLPLTSFLRSLWTWLPEDTSLGTLGEFEDMMKDIDRFDISRVGGRLVVVGCAIPDFQREMGSS